LEYAIDFRLEQCSREGLDRADVGPGRARLNRNADERDRNVRHAVGQQHAPPRQIVDSGAGEDGNVRRLARRDAGQQAVGRRKIDLHFDARRHLVPRDKRRQGTLDGKRGKDFQRLAFKLVIARGKKYQD
jgi:hypothetical protein